MKDPAHEALKNLHKAACKQITSALKDIEKLTATPTSLPREHHGEITIPMSYLTGQVELKVNTERGSLKRSHESISSDEVPRCLKARVREVPSTGRKVVVMNYDEFQTMLKILPQSAEATKTAVETTIDDISARLDGANRFFCQGFNAATEHILTMNKTLQMEAETMYARERRVAERMERLISTLKMEGSFLELIPAEYRVFEKSLWTVLPEIYEIRNILRGDRDDGE